MFAMGDEPLGIRVTPYHKPSCISKILNALDEEELRFVRESPFGKLVEIAEKPSFSGRIGRLLFSRLLKIRKKHEADGASSGSESESEADEESGLVNVVSIISDGVDLPNFEPGVGSEDEEDVLVDNLVKAAREGFSFSNSNFKGGATKADVSRMRDEAIKENNNRKTARANRKLPATDGVDAEYVASIKKMEDLMRISTKEILDTLTKYCTFVSRSTTG
uniref:Uncharacterized protein n=1 Tax=Brassica campestris TaxID=3711 RepID=A0A3P5YQM4_BRACM|nr:unnamed protein product [Brassica rapa]